MAHADPTFDAAAARLDRSREIDQTGASPPTVGQRVRLATGRDAVYDGVVHDPHDGTPLHRLAYVAGDHVLLTRRGLLRVLAAGERTRIA